MMKKLLTIILSVTMLAGGIGAVPATAATAESEAYYQTEFDNI